MNKKLRFKNRYYNIVSERVSLCLAITMVLFLFCSSIGFSQDIKRDSLRNSESLATADSIALASAIIDSTSVEIPIRKGFDISTLENTLWEVDSTIMAIRVPKLYDNEKFAKLEEPDTVRVIGGIMPYVREREFAAVFFSKEDSLRAKEVEVRRPFSELAQQRSPIFSRDTIPVNRLMLYSVAIPGLSQLYNKQYWKIPVLYGVTAGFTVGAISASKKYQSAKSAYNDAVFSSLETDEITPLRKEMDSYNSQKTIMMAGAALSYMYFLCDGAVNYKGDVHPTRKATTLSTLFPGAGQLYNKKYWKLPIVYGGLMTFIYIIDYNNRGYQRFKLAYELMADGDDSTVDEFGGYYSESQLQNTRDSFRRYRDMGILMTAGFYILQIVDAHVDAYLAGYDVSDDLATNIDIAPSIIDTPQLGKGSISGKTGYGLSLRVRF